MTKRFLTPISLANLSADPTGSAGAFYYNTSANTLKYYNGSTWVTLGSGPTNATAPVTYNSGTQTVALNIGSSLTTSSSNLIVDSTVVPYLANANTFTASPQQITVNAAGNKGLIIKGAPSQTNNLQEWQNSAGTVLANVLSNGGMYVGGGLAVLGQYGSLGTLYVNPNVATTTAMIVRGAASQTADLQEWQNSAGTILGGANALAQTYTGSTSPILVTTGGATTAASGTGTTATITTTSAHGLAVGDLVTVAGVTPTGYNGTAIVTVVGSTTTFSYLNATTGAQTVAGTVSAPAQSSVTARSLGTIPLVVRSASGASNTTFAQQWLDGTGAVVASINGNGNGNFNALNTASTVGIGNAGAYNARLNIRSNSASLLGLIIRLDAASYTADAFQIQNTAGTILTAITSAGTINFASGNTSATATAGAVTAPALVVGFITMQIAGTTVKVPYYSN